jgi:hypothetical protein
MALWDGVSWLPVALAVGVLVASVPAIADRATVHIEDEEVLLVGDPTGQADVDVDQDVQGQQVQVGTAKEYAFPVNASANRLEIDLDYDPGELALAGPCLKVNDLDLYVEGPGWSRSYPGCDDGAITLLDQDVPTGDYTVRVEADRGSTVCIPDDPSNPCSSPGIEYRLEIQVWSRG